MSSPDAKEPIFFQDVVTPKDKEPRRVFDIKKEFGEDAEKELAELGRDMAERLEHVRSSETPDLEALELRRRAAQYRVLFGRNIWTKEEQKSMTQTSKYMFDQALANTTFTYPYFNAAMYAAAHRILTGNLFWNEEECDKTMQPLADHIRQLIAQHYFRQAGGAAMPFLVLGGKRFWSQEEQEKIEAALKAAATPIGGVNLGRIADYRILRAHELRFSPDGIEIIDYPPDLQDRKIPPMPEERKF